MAVYKSTNQAVELTEKLVYVGRCTKVVKGGRRFRFSAVVVVGDKRGRVGLGLGKALELIDARAKASKVARKNLVKIPLRDGRTIHHDIRFKSGAGLVMIKSAPSGTGVIAGGAMRSLMEVLGVKDVVSKSIGSSNPHNMLAAALKGLMSIDSPKFIAEKRGKKISYLTKQHGDEKKVARRDEGADDSQLATTGKDEKEKAIATS